MKRMIVLILSFSLLLSSFANVQPVQGFTGNTPMPVTEESTQTQELDEQNLEYSSLDDQELLCHVEDTIYTELIQTLDPEMFYVEGVETTYVSKEYLEELEYNSQANIFFGYSLSDLDAQFQGRQYVFTLDESGQTSVQELVEIEDETYDRIVKNVAIGSGVILVCVTVAILVLVIHVFPEADESLLPILHHHSVSPG